VWRRGLGALVLAAVLVLSAFGHGGGGRAASREHYERILQALVQKQDSATLHGNIDALKGLYLPNSPEAKRAETKAQDRMLYIADWAKARAVRFDRMTVQVRIDALSTSNPGRVALTAVDMARYEYQHRVGDQTPAWFGLGVYHHYVIQEQNGRWYIARDSFIDPLNQDTRLGGAAHPAIVRVTTEHRAAGPINEEAARALRYATRYCGAAPGCGNDNRYNPAYGEYIWSGGDCTNYISQVLHAGGFAETPSWHWDRSANEGSADWVSAPRLVHFLEATHRVTLMARGSMPSLLAPSEKGPPALTKLRPGDLIAYWERGRVVHMAIVLGYDPDGYPVVASHSADRFREPWDLGWDRTTQYLFLRVNYPDQRG
jgi:hypothetical protein